MTVNELKKLDEQYYMPVFGARFPISFVKGEGVTLTDSEGKKYIDFLAGIATNILGYSDAGLISALQKQVANIMHVSNYFYLESQAKAAKALCDATGYGKVFFSNSGAEAVEGAIKLARKYFYKKGEKRYEIIAFQNSFHGRTLATLSATGQTKFQEAFKPLMPGFTHVAYNDIDAVANAISEHTCAVLVEPIIGEGGVIPAKPGFLKGIRELTNKKGILMIADEVQTGMGRTGAILASQKAGVHADIVTLAKALGAGVPVGAFMATDAVANAFDPSDHGSTFGGNYLATTAALYVIERLTKTDLLTHVCEVGAYFKQQLEALKEKYPSLLTDVRGDGLILALALTPELEAKSVIKKLLAAGFVAGSAGQNSLRFVPPLIITETEIDALLGALDQIFSA